MTAMLKLKASSTPSKGASLQLPGAYRRPLKKGGRYYIYWYESRERGAEQLGRFSGATLAEAEAAERAGAAEIAARYAELSKPRAHPGFMLSLIRDFETHEFPKLAASTRKVWRGHLAQIEIVFGETSLRAMQRKGARQLIKRWHEGMGAQPRTANYRLTVLARLLNWGVDEERLSRNPAAGIRRLDEGPGRAAITWTPDELADFLKHCPPHVARAVRLAALTGMRMADVIGLEWSQIEDDVIRRPTSKSRRKQRASIALYPALRALLDECGERTGHVIKNSRGEGWKSADSFDSSMRPAIDAFRAAGGADKHFHDLRGTACTFMYLGGLSARQIALALAWGEREVENRINDYVDLDAAARVMAASQR